jgi:hypothetical protein
LNVTQTFIDDSTQPPKVSENIILYHIDSNFAFPLPLCSMQTRKGCVKVYDRRFSKNGIIKILRVYIFFLLVRHSNSKKLLGESEISENVKYSA